LCVFYGSRKKNPATIFLYVINFILFVTETDCVYCAVRTECVNIIQINVGLCLAVLRRVELPGCHRRSFGINPMLVYVRFMVVSGRGSFPRISGRLCRSCSTSAPHLSMWFSHQKDKWTQAGSVSKSSF
jgi:hypothetical protein